MADDNVSQVPDDEVSLKYKELLDTMPPELAAVKDKIGKPSRRQRLAKRIGRRGAALLMFGVLYFVSGFPLLVEPARSTLHIYELRVWAVLFTGAAVIAGVSAFRRHVRHDKAGFLALLVVGWLWVTYTTFSSVLHIFMPIVFPSLWSLSVSNVPIMIMIAVTSGWPESFEPVDLAHNLHLPHPEESEDAG